MRRRPTLTARRNTTWRAMARTLPIATPPRWRTWWRRVALRVRACQAASTMPWPSWEQAATTAVVLTLVSLIARRFTDRRAQTTAAVAQEVALVSFLYMLWRLARQLP